MLKIDMEKNSKVKIIVAIIGAAGIIIAALITSGSVNEVFRNLSKTAEIRITYPNSDPVQMKDTIIGTAKNIPDGQQLWIAIYPQGDKFYPQNPIDVQNDGSWSLPVQFGEAQNVGAKFDIYAVLADKNAQKTLNNYTDESRNANSWKGMSELPDGTKTITKLTVARA
jgi:hypothetical protein